MSLESALAKKRKPRSKRKGRFSLLKLWPGVHLRKQWGKAFQGLTPITRMGIATAIVFALWLGLNFAYQVLRKPSELFFPVSGSLNKTPPETWRKYGSLFEKHSTSIVTPDFLAALAQVEGSGNPVARTNWRWSLGRAPFEVYRPASSASGMFQITNGTFAEARRYCIHDHLVAEDGPWTDSDSCWFNSLYTRTVPTNAVELTSAYLDRVIANTLRRQRITDATLQQKQDLAAIVHLCGAGAGEAFARRGFRLVPGQRCGDYAAQGYVARINQMKRVFKGMRP